MSTIGLLGLFLAFASIGVSIICLAVGQIIYASEAGKEKPRASRLTLGETFAWTGRVASAAACLALTVCCGVLVYCFFSGDTSLNYVVTERSSATGNLAWLFKLAGLWAGREGSLLFWAWLISVFNVIVAFRGIKQIKPLDNMALMVSQIVLAAFVGILLFSETNTPFAVTPAQYFDADGNLQGAATLWGMNAILEHWAMAIHPPTLFVGYAGLTVPFAYAIAALIVNDSSKAWVERVTRYTIFSWIMLTIGIGLGAIWAYGVLGWGGYWGWDPVENASLLSWLIALALMHSFTVYRQRGAFKRWSVMGACVAFAYVILGTFITRSGVVNSVHAFAGDSVSLALFLALTIAAVLAGIVGLIYRRKSFAADTSTDDVEHVASKDAAYYFNNVILFVFSVILAYMTLSSALPAWLPFGGESLSVSSYNALARPLGIIYVGILALAPLLAWGKTDKKEFARRIKLPAICAVVIFAGLMVYFFMYLLPGYNEIIAAGGSIAEELLLNGSPVYYAILSVLGFAVASLLCCTALFMLGRAISNYAKTRHENLFKGFLAQFKGYASSFGGGISHLGIALVLIGLIGSSMYSTEKVVYLAYDEENDTAESL
ncbi:MAG: cytochrome c biogenesis protein CcsA, partial [Eggerthellaceae bacterium]|nr:cytochrome c biogenesis protein CcsA [Eggerthellaceae bacterium]